MREDREHQAERAVGQQFAGHARTDHLDAAVVDRVAERRAHLLHRRLLRGLAAGLLRNADQHVGRPAELLQLDVAETEPLERRAHLRDIGGPDFACTSISVPPSKSMPKFRPCGERTA